MWLFDILCIILYIIYIYIYLSCLLYQKQCSMPARKWTEQYNAKRESMKDYKCFFYQYSEFHIFTRESSVWNCYYRTNYNIWYQIIMKSLQEGTLVPVTHVGQSHPTKTFNSSHPLNVFAEQLILNAWKGSWCQRHCQISGKGSHKHCVRL